MSGARRKKRRRSGREAEPSPTRNRRKGERRPRRATNRWWQAMIGMSSLPAIVIFGILIISALSVPLVIRFVTSPEVAPIEMNAAEPPQPVDQDSAKQASEPDPAEADIVAASITLPADASAAEHRQLRRILIVGQDADMYPTIEAALQARQPGDIIELHNREPVFCRPGASWTVSDHLIIRAGKGVQPIVVREPTLPGMLVSFSADKQNPEARVTLSGLCFVNVTPPNSSGGPRHASVYASCGIDLNHCLFVTTNAGLKWEAERFQNRATITDCYFYGLQTDVTDLINTGHGELIVQNNLIVGGRRAITVGGGLDPNSGQFSNVRLSGNTILHCEKLLTLYGPSRVTSEQNLFARQRQSHAFVVGTPVRSMADVHRMFNYKGRANVFFQTRWGIYPTKLQQGNGIARWQHLTQNSELQPRMLDPGFLDPKTVAAAEGSLQPARGLAASINASTSLPAGAVTGRLPNLPNGLGSIVQDALRKSGLL